MDILFLRWYELHSNILQLQVSILECGIMGSKIKFLDRKHLETVGFSIFFCLLHMHHLMFLLVEIFSPSNQRGSNRNTHLQSLRMLDNFSGFLRITITDSFRIQYQIITEKWKFIPSAKRGLAASKLVARAPTPNRSGLLLQWPKC